MKILGIDPGIGRLGYGLIETKSTTSIKSTTLLRQGYSGQAGTTSKSTTGITGTKGTTGKGPRRSTTSIISTTGTISKVEEVIIVTGDRDLMQLVNEKVKLYMPTRGMSEGEMVGVNEVKGRLGVLPEQVVDYKALVGDGSDNYPGVPGVGPKGAIGLIREIGGIGEIWEKIDTVKNENLKKKLIKGKESGELSYKLATIKIDVEVELDLEKLKVEELNKERLGEFFRQMGFRSLVKRLSPVNSVSGINWVKGEKGNKGKTENKNIIYNNQQSLF